MVFTSFLPRVFLIASIIYSAAIAQAQQPVSIEYQQQLADSLYESRSYEKAATAYEKLLEQIKESNEAKARAAFNAGRSYDYTGAEQKAIALYELAADIFLKIDKPDNHYICFARIANLKDDEGQFDEAIVISQKIVDYFIEKKDSVSAAKNLGDLALFYYHKGEVQKSIELYSKGLAWYGNLDDSGKAKVFNQLGNIWADDLKDENKALEYYGKSLALKIKAKASPQSVSAAYNNIGISYKNLGNTDSSFYYFNKALNYADSSGIPKFRVTPLINIGNHFKRVGNIDKAIETYKEILSLSDYVNINQRVTIRINLGMLNNSIKNYNEAIKHLIIAEDLLKTTNHISDKAEVAGHKAEAYYGLKNYENAYLALIDHKLYSDSVRMREREQEVADMMVKYESAEKDNALLEQEQLIQKQALNMQKRTTILVSIIACILLLTSAVFYLFKKKQAEEQKAKLELKLTEQKEILRIQEERLRISRDLHDNIGSYLTLINASVEQFPSLSETALQERIPEVQNSLAMSMRELRKTVWLLNKPKVSIDEVALRLRDFFKPLHQNGTHITVQATGNTEQTLTEIQTTHLFRIIQEAVNNAYKYSSAKRIQIELMVEENNALSYSVKDDGKGFDTQNTAEGNGLYNMKSRTAELNGELQISSVLSEGTTVAGSFRL